MSLVHTLTPLAVAPAHLTAGGTMSGGEAITFAIIAVFTVACALGVLTARRAVSAAVCMIGIMIGLAVTYVLNEAPFLGVTQVVVYTGAVMTLVLFVIMLVGVGGDEPMGGTTQRVQRPLIMLTGLLLAGVLGYDLLTSTVPHAVGLQDGSLATPQVLAEFLFTNHVAAMELSAILLITAAVGALTLTHRQRVTPRRSQQQIAADKMAAYAARGVHPGQKPMPGVYASTNTAAAPALDAQGQAVEDSIPRALRARGQGLELADVSPELDRAQREIPGTSSAAAAARRMAPSVSRSGMPAMPGAAAPVVTQLHAPRPAQAGEGSAEGADPATSTDGPADSQGSAESATDTSSPKDAK